MSNPRLEYSKAALLNVAGEIVEGDRAVVLFDTEPRGVPAQGLNVRMAERLGPLEDGPGP